MTDDARFKVEDLTRYPGIEETLHRGTNFLFLGAPRSGVDPGNPVRGRVLPLWNRSYRMPFGEIRGHPLRASQAGCLAADREVYDPGAGPVRLVAVFPARCDEPVTLELERDGAPFSAEVIVLDWNGMACWSRADLPAGRYRARVQAEVAAFRVAGEEPEPGSDPPASGAGGRGAGETPITSRPVPLSRLGTSWFLGAGGEGETPWRVGAVVRGDPVDAPVTVASPLGPVGRIEVRRRLEAPVLTLLHPGEPRVIHRGLPDLEPGEVLEFGVGASVVVAALGAFVAGEPWEGAATFLPAELPPFSITGALRARGPARELALTLDNGCPGRVDSAFVLVRDPGPEPAIGPARKLFDQLAGEIRRLEALGHPGPGGPGEGAGDMPGGGRPERDGTARIRIGEALVAEGLISPEQLEEALVRQRSQPKRIGQILAEMMVLSERDLTEMLAFQLGVPFLDLSSTPLEPGLAGELPASIARRYQVVPVARPGEELEVAMADPRDQEALEAVSRATGFQLRPRIALGDDLARALDLVYGPMLPVADAGDGGPPGGPPGGPTPIRPGGCPSDPGPAHDRDLPTRIHHGDRHHVRGPTVVTVPVPAGTSPVVVDLLVVRGPDIQSRSFPVAMADEPGSP